MSEKYQVLDPLSDNEYEDLRADIAEHGVMVPVTVDENGATIDGHHRRRAAEETGQECPVHVVTGLSEDQKYDMAFRLNLVRRQMNNKQKREVIARYLQGRPEASDRLAARVLGVSDKTVAAERSRLEETAEIPQFPAERLGGRGRTTRVDEAAAEKRQAELEKRRTKAAEKQAEKRAEQEAEEARWREAHEAVGGAVARTSRAPSLRVQATQDRIKAAMSDCILALTRALQDPGLDVDLVRAESALPRDFRITDVHGRLRRLVKEFGDRLTELAKADKASRTERESADRQ